MTDEIIIAESENVKKVLNEFENAMGNVKGISPLTFCITNFVTVTDCANAALAIGASPIMSNGAEEGKGRKCENGYFHFCPLIS